MPRVKIAVIDSGVHAGHPHVGAIAGGIGITAAGFVDDFVDRLGHGTAVAGAIREKATDAEIYAVKIFDRRLSAEIDTIARALEWCFEHGMDLINLSVGTPNAGHRERLLRPEALVVGVAGMLPCAIPVAADPDCPRESFYYRDGVFYASPYPRPIPGVPPERNLHGVSFAVANMTGFAAQLLRDVAKDQLRAGLEARATRTGDDL